MRDVRERVSRGAPPVPEPAPRKGDVVVGDRSRSTPSPSAPAVRTPADTTPLLQKLSRDPALRMSADGRELLRWLHRHSINTSDSTLIVRAMPGHCVSHLVELASRCSANWAQIAADLGQVGLHTDQQCS